MAKTRTVKDVIGEWAVVRDDLAEYLSHGERGKVLKVVRDAEEQQATLLAEIKQLAGKLEFPVGAPKQDLGEGFSAFRKNKSVAVNPEIFETHGMDLVKAGVLAPPSAAQLKKAVDEKVLPAEVLNYVPAPGSAGYTVQVEVPKP